MQLGAFQTTDPSLYIKTKDGLDQKIEMLFDDIILETLRAKNEKIPNQKKS